MLSSDWFYPHWHQIGLSFEARQRASIQKHARVCVAELVGTAKQYWGVAFSHERIAKTKDCFFSRTKQGPENHADLQRIKVVAEHVLFAAKHYSSRSLWLFEIITDELLRHEGIPEGLSRKLVDLIRRARADTGVVEDSDFEGLCLESQTSWDRYLRNLTPDLPTFLSDTLSDLLVVAKAQGYWLRLFDLAQAPELSAIVGWYRRKAHEIGADAKELSFPAWLTTS